MSARRRRTRRAGAIVAVTVFALAACPAITYTRPLQKAREQAKADIKAARAALHKTRDTVAAERLSLVREAADVERSVREHRTRAERLRRRVEEQSAQVDTMRREAEALEEHLAGIRSLITDQRRSFETMIPLVEAERLRPALAALDKEIAALSSGETPLQNSAATLLELVTEQAARERMVTVVPGSAIGSAGREWAGRFVQLGGGQGLFIGAEAGAPAGPVHLELNSSRLHVRSVAEPSRRDGIAALAAGNAATAPVDLTGGEALRPGLRRQSLAEHLQAGGVIMIPLLALAALCLLVGLFKLVQLLLVRTDFEKPLAAVLELLQAGQITEAAARAEGVPKPLRSVIEEGIEHRDAPRESLEEILYETIMFEVPRLRNYLSVLAVGAAVAPLLGLLGTVTGMIRTFNLISVFGTGDPRLLSSGISEALVTTEAGLVIAVPLLLLHAYLNRRVRSIEANLEKSAVSFVNALKIRGNGER